MEHPTQPCTIWQGYTTAYGYGQKSRRVDGITVTEHAHRLAWRAVHGDIPDGMEVHHACGNRACVNVDHLRVVAVAEHAQIHREQRTHCKNGHEWTPENTYTRADGGRNCRGCAKEYARRRRANQKVAA